MYKVMFLQRLKLEEKHKLLMGFSALKTWNLQ